MENVYMYGPTGGRPLTEDLPYAAETRKGEVRARRSRDLFAANDAGKVMATAGRASDFFGPMVTDAAAGESVFGRAIAGNAAQVAGDPELPHTYHLRARYRQGATSGTSHSPLQSQCGGAHRVEPNGGDGQAVAGRGFGGAHHL